MFKRMMFVCSCLPFLIFSKSLISPELSELQSRMQQDESLNDYLRAFPFKDYKIYHVSHLGNFYLDDIQDGIKMHLMRGLIWEPYIADLMKKYVRKGTLALDVGAHIGTHTLLMSQLVGTNGLVIAFEPQIKIFRELTYNISCNGIKNIIPLNLVVGDEAKEVQMSASVPGNEGGTGLGVGGNFVNMIPLDMLNLSNISFMKIDVEGYEDFVLDGAKETILRNRPVIIIELMGGNDYNTAPTWVKERIDHSINKIKKLGYRVVKVSVHDYLAIPK